MVGRRLAVVRRVWVQRVPKEVESGGERGEEGPGPCLDRLEPARAPAVAARPDGPIPLRRRAAERPRTS